MRKLLFVLLGSVAFSAAKAQQPFTIMAYNLLNFDGSSTDRTPYLKTIMDSLQPDIVVLEEVVSQAGLNLFKSQALNGFYNCGTFIANGSLTTQNVCYKVNRFKFISNTPIKTAVRDINQFKMVSLDTGDTLRLFGVHLKASDTDTDAASRNSEIQLLRQITNTYTIKQDWIVLGDFNFYRSNELGYLSITNNNSTVNGNAIDSRPLAGEWGSAAYAPYHTQSPRTRSFGGGVTGGMDDRFDMILYSKSIANAGGLEYVANSHWAVGNDGQHYNDSINKMPNSSVSQNMANALHYASDHIPIIAQFVYIPVGLEEKENPISSVFPNPTNGKIEVKMKEIDNYNYEIVTVFGQVLIKSQFTGNSNEIDLQALSKGIYFLKIGTGIKNATQRIILE